jgi:hypothetical protein
MRTCARARVRGKCSSPDLPACARARARGARQDDLDGEDVASWNTFASANTVDAFVDEGALCTLHATFALLASVLSWSALLSC